MTDFLEKLEKLNQYVSQLKDKIDKLETENKDLKKTIAFKDRNDETAIKKLEDLLEKVKDLWLIGMFKLWTKKRKLKKEKLKI